MIRIAFIPPDTPEWKAWLQECQVAQADLNHLVQRGEPAQAQSAIYGKLKEPVFIHKDGPFAGKCAFCETFIYSAQHGDMEHFRPKGAIKDVHNKPILLPNGSPHRGYYWLAYDYANLLPSCQLCNQPSTGRSEGVRIGKWNAFPLADEAKRALKPGDEVNEDPLLINPVHEDPVVHLGLNAATGVLFAMNGSPRGQACIDILGLNLRDLPSKRLDKYQTVRSHYIQYFNKRLTGADSKYEATKLEAVRSGRDDYALAGKEALQEGRRLIDEIRNEL
jgi:hypothetical protein